MAIVAASFYAGSGASVEVGGGNWTLTANVVGAPNKGYSQSRLTSGDPSDHLRCYTFGASIPDGATALGLTVELYKLQTIPPPCSVKDLIVQWHDGVGLIGQNRADLVSEWPTSYDPPTVYGGSSDLWGLALTPAQYRAAGFGLIVQADFNGLNSTARVDAVRWTLHYDDGLSSGHKWWGPFRWWSG